MRICTNLLKCKTLLVVKEHGNQHGNWLLGSLPRVIKDVLFVGRNEIGKVLRFYEIANLNCVPFLCRAIMMFLFPREAFL